MGMLARLAQAAYLLGKVLQHRQDPTSNPQFNENERHQIDKSLRALLRLAYEGNSVPVTTICPQTAMCFGALAELYWPDLLEGASLTTVDLQAKTKTKKEALELLRPIARQAYHDSGVWFRNRPFTLAQASPLLLPWTYQAAVMFLELSRWFQRVKLLHEKYGRGPSSEENERCIIEANRGAASMTRKLSLLGGQWCAAGKCKISGAGAFQLTKRRLRCIPANFESKSYQQCGLRRRRSGRQCWPASNVRMTISTSQRCFQCPFYQQPGHLDWV